MSPPDSKRREARRGAASSSAATHVFQGGKDPAGPSTSSASRQDVLAPPPRVQLTSTPSPEDQAPRTARSHRGSNAPSTRSTTASIASMSTTGAADTVVKEKDCRIVKLERDLSQLAQNESESASFWQAKYSALNQQFLRIDTELRTLKDELRAQETETDEVVRGWRHAVANEMAARDDEIRELRVQVRGLKEWVSTSTRSDGTAATSDEVFGDGWARLCDGLQNWVITNFRKAKLDLSRADETTLSDLAELVPMYEELVDQGAKLHLLQSLVSRIVFQLVFASYFVGVSAEQQAQLQQTEKLMASLVPAQAVNQWRSVTLSIVNKEATKLTQLHAIRAAEAVVGKITQILDAVTTDTLPRNDSAGHSTMEFKHQAIRQLVSNAIDLSRLLAVQRAVFEVWMPEILPHQQLLFDPATMEDLMGEGEESLVQREISCVTFPGIIKRGDETGSQLHFRNVIFKARVLCGPAS